MNFLTFFAGLLKLERTLFFCIIGFSFFSEMMRDDLRTSCDFSKPFDLKRLYLEVDPPILGAF